MKTTTTLLITMIMGSITASAQTTFGLLAGATYSTAKSKFESLSETGDYKIGFTTGIFADMKFSKNFSFQPALNFTQKGWSYDDDMSSETYTLNYLEVPMNFVYSFQPKQGLYIGAGPSMAFGLSGKDKWEDKNSGEKISDDIHFGTANDELKSFSLGANFIAGYKLKNGLLFSAGYNFDFTDMSNGDDSMGKTSLKSNYFALKIGWVFPAKTK